MVGNVDLIGVGASDSDSDADESASLSIAGSGSGEGDGDGGDSLSMGRGLPFSSWLFCLWTLRCCSKLSCRLKNLPHDGCVHLKANMSLFRKELVL